MTDRGPRRIASLLASGTEILFALGLGDRVVAVSHECDFPPQVAALPRVTFTHVAAASASREIDRQVQEMTGQGAALYEIDRQRLVELAPDLIVTQAQCDVCAVRYADVIDLVTSSERLAGSTVVALNPNTLEDIFADIRRVGAAAEAIEEANTYVAQLQARVQCVRNRAEQISRTQRPRVAVIEWIEPLMLAANWTPELVALAGGDCPLVQAGRHSTYGSWDDVRRLDPQVIVCAPCGFDLHRTIAESQVLRSIPGWNELSAVSEGRVWAVDGNAYFNRSGPRIVDSLEILAHLFHPQRFAAPLSPIASRSVWARLQTVGQSLIPVE